MARRHASAEAFALVGMDTDPTPGDDTLIERIRHRYAEIADSAEEAGNVLRRGGGISQGRGSAMDKLAELVGDDLPDKLTTTTTSYREAADGYAAYVPALREAQDTFDRAVDEAQSAAPAANAAPPVLPAHPSERERVAAGEAQDSIDEAQGRLSAARGLADQAREIRERAKRSLEERLDDAAGNAIPERSFFEKIGDFFTDNPIFEVILGIVVGVVSVFFPVLGFVLGAAVFAVTQLPGLIENGFTVEGLLKGLLSFVGGAVIGAVAGLAIKALAPVLLKNVSKLKDLVSSGTSRGSGDIRTGIPGSNDTTRPAGPDATSPAGSPPRSPLASPPGTRPGTPDPGSPAPVRPGGDPTQQPAVPHIPGIERTPDDELFTEFGLPPTLKRPTDENGAFLEENSRIFTHARLPGQKFELFQTEPEGFSPPVFRTDDNELVFVDEGGGFRKVVDNGGDLESKLNEDQAPRIDLTPFEEGPPGDRFRVEFRPDQNFPQVGSRFDVPPDGEVHLVPTSSFEGVGRTDISPGDPRTDSLKEAFRQGLGLPPIKLSPGGHGVADGNHRIAAARELGLPLVPVQLT